MDCLFSTALNESELRDLRKENIIIKGVPELPSGDLKERATYDRKKCDEIFSLLELDKDDISHVRRIGKLRKDGKRFLRVRCSNSEKKMTILYRAKSLKNYSTFKNVFVCKDLTPLQQKEQQKLREELKRRKEDNEDVVIFRGKVCNRKEISHFQ